MLSDVIRLRRELHENPEIGFDLPRTLAILKRELDAIGVDYTEKYGKSSIVATVNPENTDFTIGVRADIDALPIEEENDVPYRSRIAGQMHACGHDAHAAVAMETLKRIYAMRDTLPCRVKFLFQSAEEYTTSGAKLMVEDGVMEDIDCVVALHCDTDFPVGVVGMIDGPMNSRRDGFKLRFYGKSTHAATQEKGNDAIMMAVRAYTDIEFAIAKEVGARQPVIFNVGAIHGGVTNNIIADCCEMVCTLRSWDTAVGDYMLDKIRRIGEAVAATAGGRFEFETCKQYPIVPNDPVVGAALHQSISKLIGEENLRPRKRGMGGEDFSDMAMKKPGYMFRLGVRNDERGITVPVHNGRFDIDEDALELGVQAFISFITDNSRGELFKIRDERNEK